jgi:hypothetical protein
MNAAKEARPATLKLDVVNGGLIAAPIWLDRPRAKNWAAVIDIDGTAPGGLSRVFLPYGRGAVFYMIESVMLYDALEFAADQVSWGGNKTANRWYGIVVAKGEDFLELEPTKDSAKAVLASKSQKRENRADREESARRRRAIIAVLLVVYYALALIGWMIWRS